MKREINLRTREFVISREFYWPRVLLTTLLIGLILVLLLGSVVLYYYKIALAAEVKRLLEIKQQLAVQAEKVDQIEAQISEVKRLEELRTRFGNLFIPWSEHIASIDALAAEQELEINRFTGSGDGKSTIKGSGLLMRNIAQLVLNLDSQEYLSGVYFTEIVLDKDSGKYNFQVRATVNTAEKMTDGGSE